MRRARLRDALARVALAGALLATAGCAHLPVVPELPAWSRLPGAAVGPPLVESPAADLPPPGGLRAHSGELRAVPLHWDPVLVGDVGGYAVERAPSREGPFSRIARVPGRLHTHHSDRGNGAGGALEDGATRFYRVRAHDAGGRLSAQASAVVAATTAPAPPPPADLRAWSLQPRQVPLTWTPSADPGVASYVIYRSPTSWGPFETLAEIDGRHVASYVDGSLGDLRVFYYQLAARNGAGGEGPAGASVRAVTKPEPLPPLGLHVTGQGLGENRLAWEPNVEPDLAAYRLLRRRAGGEWEPVAELPAAQTGARDGAVAPGEVLEYALVALDRHGLESAPGAPLRVAGERYGLTATPVDGGVRLAWRPRRAEGFRRARVLRLGWLRTRELVVTDEASYLDRDVKPGGHYRYAVQLLREDGTPAPVSTPVALGLPLR